MCPPAIIPAVIAVGSMAAATAVSVASSKKAAQAQTQAQAQVAQAKAEAVKTINNTDTKVQNSVEKTASQLKDNKTEKRTISSLRIPLKANTGTTGINTGDVNQTGLNIPV